MLSEIVRRRTPRVLSEIVRFEWRYHLGRATFAAAGLLFLLLGFALTASGFGPDNLPVNAPYLITESLGFLSLLASFAAAVFVSNAALRDVEHRMLEIVHCTPVGRFELLAGRFGGAFLATFSAASLAALGMALASFMPWLPAERAGALDVRAYGWALLTVSAPNVLFVTALLFAVASLTRSAIATYAASLCLYVLYFVAAALTDSPLMAASSPGAGSGAWAALLDPFGLSSFFAEVRYWSVAEKSTRLAGLSGPFLLNRALWITLSFAIGAATYHTFSFRLLRRERPRAASARPGESPPGSLGQGESPPGSLVERPKGDLLPSAIDGRSSRGGPLKPVAHAPSAVEGAGSWFASFGSALRLELGALLRGKAFLLLLAAWAGLAGSEIYGDVLAGEYGTSSYPTTGLLVRTLQKPLSLVGSALLVYYSAEVFWREHRFRLSPLLNATPAHRSALVVAKCASLAALVGCLVGCGIAAGLGVQVSKGYFRFEPALYLSLFYFVGLPLALFAPVAALVHVLSPNKHVGMVLTLLFVLVAQRGRLLGLEHHLWRFGSAPPVAYSAMNGFDQRALPFHWYMAFWASLAAIVGLLAARLWRALGAGGGELWHSFRRPGPTWRAVAVLGIVATATGGWVFYNTRVVREGETAGALFDWKAAYERAYRPTVATLAQPSVDDLAIEIDLFPGEQRYRAAGRLGLVNRTAATVGTVYVSLPRRAASAEASVLGARLAERDRRFGMYRFELDAPLAPGARTELRFELSFAERGFADDEPEYAVVENGSLVWGFHCLPTIGYRESYEISDERERRQQGLPASARASAQAEAGHGDDLDGPGWVNFAITLSTAADQIAVAPGRLERSWEREGRRYFHYRSSALSRNVLAFAAARYGVERRRHRGVDVEVYYHREHGVNVPRMLDAAVASLDLFTEAFGPYPHGQLKIVEVPGYWGFGGFATPDMILFGENRGFLTDARDPRRVDLVTRRVAHEVAHQWWGHQLSPPSGPGAAAVVESLAKYSEMLVIERLHGREQARDLLEIELDRYLAGRARETHAEVPLLEVGHQPYLFYAKGSLVMHAVRGLIGEPALNEALRGFVRDHAGPGGRPTSLELLDRLLRAAPEPERPLIEDWTKAIVLYDLRLDSASAERLADGRYEVKLRLSASRGSFDGSGRESPLALHEAIEVGVFGAHPGEDKGQASALSLAKYELRQGVNELSIVVEGRPERAVVDPDVSRIDRNRFDNAMVIVEARAPVANANGPTGSLRLERHRYDRRDGEYQVRAASSR